MGETNKEKRARRIRERLIENAKLRYELSAKAREIQFLQERLESMGKLPINAFTGEVEWPSS